MGTAAAAGNAEIVAELLLAKANPDVQDVDGETPLHYAALAGQESTARLLLRAGAQASVESFFMETPFRVASQNVAKVFDVNTAAVTALLSKDICLRDKMDQQKEFARVVPKKV